MRAVKLLSCILALLSGGATDAGGQIAVIANVDTEIEDIRLAELRDLFLGRPTSVSSRPVVLFENRDVRERFYRSAFSMGVREVKQRWIQVVLTGGRMQPPVELDADEVLSRVAETSGAIAFVDAVPTAVPTGDSVRVVRIDGRLPGEPGYPLR